MPINPKIQRYVDAKQLTPIDAEMWDCGHRVQYHILQSDAVYDFVAKGRLSMTQALNLSLDQMDLLDMEIIQYLINEEINDIMEVLLLSGLDLRQWRTVRNALRDEDTQQRLRNGELTLIDLTGARTPAQTINTAQSTHIASVHKSTSESAASLLKRYKHLNLNAQISIMKNGINALAANNPKARVATRCIDRLIQFDKYKDPASDVSTHQLLALSWIAVCDRTVRTGTKEDATHQFIEGLYEIQRGYNLSDTGIDQGGHDKPICAAGTFNKLIEKLVGIHPDAALEFITSEIASLKFPSVVKEEAKNHLIKKKNTSNPKDYEMLIKKVKEEGVAVIWVGIKEAVAQRMWDVFHTLYTGKNDPNFTSLIDSAECVELGPLFFQKEWFQSPIYAEQAQRSTIQQNQTPAHVVQYGELPRAALNPHRVARANPLERHSKTSSCWSWVFNRR